MRKLFFCLIVAVGAIVGCLPAIVGEWKWSAGIVGMFFGAVIASPFAGVLTGIGRRGRGQRRSLWRGAGFSGTTGAPSDGVVRSQRWDR